MFRNFDVWNRYLDNDGHVLRGAVQFNVIGGTTKADIFDEDKTVISNPQLTDIYGRTEHQVFVKNDVTAYFYKYIGNGDFTTTTANLSAEENGIDLSDETLWSLQYTVDSVAGAGDALQINAPMAVPNMEALRSLDLEQVAEVCGEKAVTLYGYFEMGDCEPVVYIWDESATDSDDNGSVIQSYESLTGRWKMVQPTGVCDSKHFGVFPYDSSTIPVDQATRITQLVNYCNKCDIKPLFNGTNANHYFIYSYLSATSRNPIVVSSGTIFVDNAPSYFYGNWEGDPRFLNGNTKVSADLVKASWNFSDAITYNEVWLDDQCQKTTFENARVIVTYDTAGKTFSHCELVSDGHLADNTFHDCVLRGSMFIGQSLSPAIDDNCTVQPLDFVGRMDLWCRLRSQQHNPIVDCCMQTLDSHCTINLDGIWIKNALFDNFQHESAVSIGFEGCRGSVEIVCTGNPVITSEDSELVLTLTNTGEAGVGYQPAMAVHGGNIGFVSTLSFFMNFGAKNSELSGNGILVNGPCSLVDCQTALPITVRGALYCTNSTINANVVHYTVSTPAFVRMQGCTLNAYYNLTPAVANSTVNAVWANNYSSVESPILIDRTNIDPIDSHHTYTYANNSGGFLPYTTKQAVHVFTIHHSTMTGSLQPPTEPYVLTQMVLGGSDSDENGTPAGFIWPWYNQPVFDQIQMFRIGVDRFQVRAELTNWPRQLERPGTHDEYKYNRYHDATLAAVFISGFTWGIMPFYPDPANPEPFADFAANPEFFAGSLSFSFNNMPSFSDYHMAMAIRYECLERHDD